jgi:histidine triad (HIT) family protein
MVYSTGPRLGWMLRVQCDRTRRWGVAEGCVFCEIVHGSRPAEVVLDDDVAVAFLDRSPLFHGHTLVVPRLHVVTLADLPLDQLGPFWARVQHLSAEVPRVMGAQGAFVANNNIVSQSVAHLHVHVVPRRKGDGLRGFFWPRTKYADGEAASVARRLREQMMPLEA